MNSTLESWVMRRVHDVLNWIELIWQFNECLSMYLELELSKVMFPEVEYLINCLAVGWRTWDS